MHTYINTYIHAYMHAYIHTCIHTYIHTCMHTYIPTCMQAWMHACTHAYISVHNNIYSNTEYACTTKIQAPPTDKTKSMKKCQSCITFVTAQALEKGELKKMK